MSGRPRSTGVAMAAGVGAALFFGALGLAVWLLWIWFGTRREVRAKVGPGARATVIALGATGFVANIVGFAMTATALRRAFITVAEVDPSHKARFLADAIGDAMVWTAFGLVALAVSMLVTLVAGHRLLRASERVTS